jgi:predicted FMN-binding regulatory protein PaiB
LGVKIEVTKVVAKSKLSQNKEIDDFNGVKKKMLQKDKHSLYKAMKDINLNRE